MIKVIQETILERFENSVNAKLEKGFRLVSAGFSPDTRASMSNYGVHVAMHTGVWWAILEVQAKETESTDIAEKIDCDVQRYVEAAAEAKEAIAAEAIAAVETVEEVKTEPKKRGRRKKAEVAND